MTFKTEPVERSLLLPTRTQETNHEPDHRHPAPPTQSLGTALVTGASGGIGAVYADRLARRGYDLVLVARSQNRLDEVAGRIQAEHGRTVTTLRADLGDRDDLARVETLLRENASLTLLVNNAGFGSVAPLLSAGIETMQDMIDVNVTAVTRLTYAAVPGFVARGRGGVINISSIVAIAPELLNGVYGGSKAFVLTFTQSLQHEVADKGVRVQAVLPGATATEFWDIAGMHHSNMPESWVMTSADMVDAALLGFERGEVVTIPSLQDGAQWDAYEAARLTMAGNLSSAQPAPRYRVTVPANAA
ncbi:SDR family oxidoreductase [Aureimonas sp. SK2]|uniref:SDR family NAD(P)-dependent oxidoreductase n=1 Tax=Aureimonas sp. SK2 TaxID=3015992 RepID=UPI002443D02D|nr:SDR family oxidoreductase [Aureimonas sp. SK2]